MTEIHRIVRAAAIRLFAIDLLRTLAVTLTVAGTTLLVVKIIEKLTPVGFRWDWLLPAGGAAAVLGAVAWSALRRKRGVDVAREVDERAGLHESLSTALLVERSEDGWSRNVVESARERAREVRLAQAVPVTAPRMWPVPAAVGAALLAVWWLPRHDLTGVLQREREAEQERAQVRQVELEIKAQEQRLDQLLAATGIEPPEKAGEAEGQERPDPRTPEQLRRDQIRRLTEVADRLREEAEGERAERLEAMQKAMRQLKTPGPGPAEEMMRRMARGEFTEAREALEKLADKLRQGDLSEEERKNLEQQLAAMQEQLEKMAEEAERQREQLAEQMQRALEQGGMSSEQAQEMAERLAEQIQQNPQAAQELVQQAMQQAEQALQQMTPQQREQLQQQMQQMAQQMAQQCQNGGQCENMGQAMGQMAQALQQMQGGQMGPEGQQAMQDLAQQLGEMEMLQQQMQSLQAALAECQGQMGQLGMSMAQKNSNRPGGHKAGFGFAGQGANDAPDADPSQYEVSQAKTATENTGGPIIGSMVVYGAQVKGESRAAFASAAQASSQAASEAIDSMRVPREYQDAVRHYFGRLEAKAAEAAEAASTGEAAE